MSEILAASLALLIAIATAVIGYRYYLVQREHELVRKRYLDEGIDLLIGSVEQVLSVFRYNSVLSLALLKRFRDFGEGCDENSLSGFLPLDHSNLAIAATHRVRLLLGDNTGWDSLQGVFAFVDNANTFFSHDLAATIRAISSGKLKATVTNKDIFLKYHGLIENLLTESHKHYVFLNTLINIATILEREKFTFKSIAKFQNREDVRSLVKAMKSDRKTEQNGGH